MAASSALKAISIPAELKEKYTIGDEIARGKYGVVFKAKCKKSNEDSAVKIMLKKGNKKDDVEREVSVLRKLNHPVVLRMMDFFEYSKEYVLVTELLHGGEFFDYIAEKEFLIETEAIFYMKQILEGLQYCHSRKIVHLDLKPENIVLKDDSAKQLKLIDFGTAQDLSATPNVKAMVGTPEFIAPEVLNYDPVTVAADMWAIGVIAYVLLTGLSPFLGDSDGETVGNISMGEFEYPDPEEGYEDISSLAKDFIDSLLKQTPRERCTAPQSLAHKWIYSQAESTTASRLGTSRLRAFRARRKWLATIRAVRLSVSLFRTVSRPRGESSCSLSPPSCPPNDVFSGK